MYERTFNPTGSCSVTKQVGGQIQPTQHHGNGLKPQPNCTISDYLSIRTTDYVMAVLHTKERTQIRQYPTWLWAFSQQPKATYCDWQKKSICNIELATITQTRPRSYRLIPDKAKIWLRKKALDLQHSTVATLYVENSRITKQPQALLLNNIDRKNRSYYSQLRPMHREEFPEPAN